MLKLPKSISILGTKYDILVQSRDSDEIQGAWGRAFLSKGKIFVAADQSPAETLSTLIHETVEVLNYKLALNFDEETIRRLEAGLFAVAADNGYLEV